MENEKEKSKKISPKLLTVILTLITVIAGAVGYAIYTDAKNEVGWFQHEVTVDELKQKVNDAMQDYSFSAMTLKVNEKVADEGDYTYEYTIVSEINNSRRSYMYRDSEGKDIYQYWRRYMDRLDTDVDPIVPEVIYDEDGNELPQTELIDSSYVVYMYADDVRSWVKDVVAVEPVDTYVWDFTETFGEYTLLEETGNWYDTGDECYILQTIGGSDDWAVIYEELYVRKSDFLPMGIVVYAVSDNGKNIVENVDDASEVLGIEVDSMTTEIPDYNQVIEKYSLTFSNENIHLMDEPEQYMTSKAYIDFIYGDRIKDEELTKESAETDVDTSSEADSSGEEDNGDDVNE